jgi:hypothetical protein
LAVVRAARARVFAGLEAVRRVVARVLLRLVRAVGLRVVLGFEVPVVVVVLVVVAMFGISPFGYDLEKCSYRVR